jgi:hypothetical protein
MQGKEFARERKDILIVGRDPVAVESVGCILAGEEHLSIHGWMWRRIGILVRRILVESRFWENRLIETLAETRFSGLYV